MQFKARSGQQRSPTQHNRINLPNPEWPLRSGCLTSMKACHRCTMRTGHDPLRIPTGMRVTQSRPGRSLENVIRHNHDEHVLQIKKSTSLHQDTRKLWRWQDGQQRTHAPEEVAAVEHGSFVKTVEGAHWLLKADKRGAETLNRHISGFSIPKNVLFRCLGEMESIPRGWKHDGEKPVATRIHGLRDLCSPSGVDKNQP